MSGVTFYGVSLLEGQDQGDVTELVFEDRIEALKVCKKFKGSRFKCFADREEAYQFTQTKQVIPEVDAAIKEQPSEKLPFPTPSPQDMLLFRKTIETGNCDEFLHLVWKNPRFLISAGDTPTMIRERYRYHGLLLATFKKEYSICKAILDTITDPSFIGMLYTSDTEQVRKNRMFYLLDTYLNTPDKFLNETPLHFASKFGTLEILELFLSYPECDRDRRNTKGESPADIVCSSCKNPSPDLVAQMKSLLSQRYFVPVLRPSDFSSPALVGKPWSPDIKSPKSPEQMIPSSPLAQHKYPTDSQMMLQALAGPMSPKEAELFYKQMKTPPIPKMYQSRLSDKKMTPKKLLESRLSDIDKGLERVGRNIAHDLKVPWSEYWKFLDEFCDLSSDEGLEKLEKYFSDKRQSEEISILQPSIEPEAKSPLSDLCSKLSRLHLQSPDESGSDEEQYFTPPSTPPALFYEIPPFYIFGSQPSKTDVDVLRVLEHIELDFNKYPNVSMWKENMMQHNEEHLNRLKTPARLNAMNSTLKSPIPEHYPVSPRISSIKKCLNSPRKTRDLTAIRLSFDSLEDE